MTTAPLTQTPIPPAHRLSLLLSGLLASFATGCFDPEPYPRVDLAVATASDSSDSGLASDTGVVSTTTTSTTTTTSLEDPSSTGGGGSTGTSSSSGTGCLESECGSCFEQLCGGNCGMCEPIGWPAQGTGLYQAMMSDVMFGHPLEILEGGRLVDLSINVSQPAQGSQARLLVYSVSGGGNPVLIAHTEPLLLQDGTNVVGVDGFVQDSAIHLDPGWYWLMVHFDTVTSLFRSIDGSDHEQVFESRDFGDPVPAELISAGSLTGYQYFISGTIRLDEP